MGNNIKISIITPVYNRENSISCCIESIRTQGYLDYEHIIIDDGSTDNTKLTIKSFTEKDNRIKLISYKGNKGVNYARNIGIKAAKGEYITFLDSDDHLEEKALWIFDYYLKNNNMMHFLFKVSTRKKDINLPKVKANIYFRDWIKGNISGDFTHLVRTEVMKKYLFIEEFIAFENLNWLRIFKATEPQLYIPEVTTFVVVRRHDSLTQRLRLINSNIINQTFLANKLFIMLYFDDYNRFNRNYLLKFITKTIILGIASDNYNKLNQIFNLVGMNSYYNKVLFFIKFLHLDIIIKNFIISYSKFKNKFKNLV
jgi:glycosyltransferase involved in cell wall biosynthesis